MDCCWHVFGRVHKSYLQTEKSTNKTKYANLVWVWFPDGNRSSCHGGHPCDSTSNACICVWSGSVQLTAHANWTRPFVFLPLSLSAFGLRVASYRAARVHLSLTTLILDRQLWLLDIDGWRLKSVPPFMAIYVSGHWQTLERPAAHGIDGNYKKQFYSFRGALVSVWNASNQLHCTC